MRLERMSKNPVHKQSYSFGGESASCDTAIKLK